MIVIAGILLAGCVPTALPTVTPTPETPTLTETPTATIDWFPATETPTPLPTEARTPTPNYFGSVGEILVEDDFTAPDVWRGYELENGRVTVANGHITLALDQADGLIYGFRPSPILDDFYAEITASPNFCQPQDEYGLMVRITGARLNHYRFAISCDGKAELRRVVNNRGTVLAEWQREFMLPTSFPSNSTLGVLVQGSSLRFFVNGNLVYSVEDAIISEGAFGVYARAGGGGPISVNFSDLVIRAVAE